MDSGGGESVTSTRPFRWRQLVPFIVLVVVSGVIGYLALAPEQRTPLGVLPLALIGGVCFSAGILALRFHAPSTRRLVSASGSFVVFVATVLAAAAIDVSPPSTSDRSESQLPVQTPSQDGSTPASPAAQYQPTITTRQSLCAGGVWLLPASHLNELPDPWELTGEWVYERGGQDVGNRYDVTVEGPIDRSVVLESLRVSKPQKITNTPEESVVVYNCLGAGEMSPRGFEINLDAVAPTAEGIAGDESEPGDHRVPAPEFPFKVSSLDPEVFRLYPMGDDCHCTWSLELTWIVAGEKGSAVISPEGSDGFRTASDSVALAVPWFRRDLQNGGELLPCDAPGDC